MSRAQRFLKIVISMATVALVAVAMAVLLPFNVIPSDAAKITEADIQAIRDKIAANEQKIKDYQNKLNSLGGEIDHYLSIKEQLDYQISYLESNIEETATLIEKYESLIARKEEQIADRESELETKYDSFYERLRLSYEQGQQGYLELLFSSESLLDFITRVDRLASVLTYEQDMLNDLERQVSELNEMKTTLASQKAEAEKLGDTQNQFEADLVKKRDEAASYLKKLQNDKAAYDRYLQQVAALDKQFDKELEEAIKKLQEQQKEEANAKFWWPLDSGWRTVSSQFGWRWNGSDYHYGIDLPAYKNSNIYAAGSGTVITARYNDSYGYYIVIDHGNTLSTCYAHCNKLLVSVGQKVERGQVIAYVGSTGNSTGYHLHFEVRKNGRVIDPLDIDNDKSNGTVESWLVMYQNGVLVDPVPNRLLSYW